MRGTLKEVRGTARGAQDRDSGILGGGNEATQSGVEYGKSNAIFARYDEWLPIILSQVSPFIISDSICVFDLGSTFFYLSTHFSLGFDSSNKISLYPFLTVYLPL